LFIKKSHPKKFKSLKRLKVWGLKVGSSSKLIVETLALGLRLRQGLVKVWAKKEAWELHFMLSRVEESVRD